MRFSLFCIFGAFLSFPAIAAPTEADMASALTIVMGEEIEAIMIVDPQCGAMADAMPGYDCSYRLDRCRGRETADCVDDRERERAVFIGGDHGWLALDIDWAQYAPSIPLHHFHPAMVGETPQWLNGAWDFDGSCVNDGYYGFGADGTADIASFPARYTLEDGMLIITHPPDAPIDLTDPAFADDEDPYVDHWRLEYVGQNAMHVTFEDGAEADLIRC